METVTNIHESPMKPSDQWRSPLCYVHTTRHVTPPDASLEHITMILDSSTINEAKQEIKTQTLKGCVCFAVTLRERGGKTFLVGYIVISDNQRLNQS